MSINKERLEELKEIIEHGVSSSIAKIDELTSENLELKNNYKKILLQLEEYVAELEKIKDNYVNSRDKVK